MGMPAPCFSIRHIIEIKYPFDLKGNMFSPLNKAQIPSWIINFRKLDYTAVLYTHSYTPLPTIYLHKRKLPDTFLEIPFQYCLTNYMQLVSDHLSNVPKKPN